MTSEIHKKIIRAGLSLLLKQSDEDRVSLVGIPVTNEDIHWCMENTVFDQKELDDIMSMALNALNMTTVGK